MKLYYSPGACAMSVQIVLRELGEKFDLVKVDLRAKTTADGGDYKTINPKGYVPALTLADGETMTEASVIVQWLADQNPGKQILPKWGTKERYRAMEWLNFISTEIHKGFSPMFNPTLPEESKKILLEKLTLRLEYLNTHFTQSEYLLGDTFSAADAYAYNVLRFSRPLKVDLSKFSKILGFMEKVEGRPAVRASIEAEGLKQ